MTLLDTCKLKCCKKMSQKCFSTLIYRLQRLKRIVVTMFGAAKDQLKQVKDLGRRLERIEDIGCSYFKPRSSRCRLQDDLLRRLDKGLLHGIVKRDHINQVRACLPVNENTLN